MSLRQWTLWKAGHTYVFRWQLGSEGWLIADMVEQVAQNTIPMTADDLAIAIRLIADSMPKGEVVDEMTVPIARVPG